MTAESGLWGYNLRGPYNDMGLMEEITRVSDLVEMFDVANVQTARQILEGTSSPNSMSDIIVRGVDHRMDSIVNRLQEQLLGCELAEAG